MKPYQSAVKLKLNILFALACTTASAQVTEGFSGDFAPNRWEAGSNAPQSLVNTSDAPHSVTLRNYTNWAISGSTFRYKQAPANGTVRFVPSLAGSTSNCASTYWYGKEPQPTQHKIPNGNNQSPITFKVSKGDTFGFAVNGENTPQNFGCKTSSPVSLTISGFQFTAESQIPVVINLAANTAPDRPSDLKVTCMTDATSTRSSSTCPVIQFKGKDYWVYSYMDNRFAVALAGYENGKLVSNKQINGTRYVHAVSVNTNNQTINIFGQGQGNQVSVPWSDL